MIELRLKQRSLLALSSLAQFVAINMQNVVTSLVVITWTDDSREEILDNDEDQPCSFNQRKVVEENFSRITASSSCGCDVASGSSITPNGWARIRQQPPSQAPVHCEQTSNPIWIAVYGTGCYNMVCGLFLRTTLTGRRGRLAPFMHC